MKTRILPCLLLVLIASGASIVFAQSPSANDQYFLDWHKKWNRAFSPVDTAALSKMLPDDFRYYWTNQTDAPHAFGELASKKELLNSVVIEEQGWQTLETKAIGNYPGEVDNYVRRSSDGQIVWLHSHQKEIYQFKQGDKSKTDSSFVATCYTFQLRDKEWIPVHAFCCYYNVKKTRSYGGLTQELDVIAHAGKKFRLTAAIRTDFQEDGGLAYLWARVNKRDGSLGFFNNTWEKPITQKEWQNFAIEGIMDEDAAKLIFGGGIRVPGVAWFDDFRLSVEVQPGLWKEIPLTNSDFEDPVWNKQHPKGWQGMAFEFVNFTTSFTDQSPFQGKYAFMLSGKSEQ